MKTINLSIIVLFNFIGGLLSYSWCYRLFIRKYSTPELYYLVFYGVCYFCLILISIWILNKIKKPFGLISIGAIIGIVITFISWIVAHFILGIYQGLALNIKVFFPYLFITSFISLNFIIYPVILLCCHYSFRCIEKIAKNRNV